MASWGAAFGGSAKPPPESDEHGGKDDEQAQGDPCDGHHVVGLHWLLGWNRR